MMLRSILPVIVSVLLFALGGIPTSHPAPAAPAERARLVLAHYMVCCPRYGHWAGVEAYEAEIKAAHDAGIDGFALNVGGWSKEPNYQRKSQLLFDAAAASGLDFKLVFSFDFLDLNDAADAILRFHQHKNYLTVGGMPVVTTYGSTPEWGRDLRALLDRGGISIFLVANYFNRIHDVAARLDGLSPEMYAARRAIEDNADIDGYFLFFPPLGNAERVARTQAEVVRLAHRHGKLAMLGIIPYYKGFGPGNSRVFESDGFSSMARQWRTAIETGSDWVEIVTWNDWGESTYVAPSEENVLGGTWWRILPHDGFLDASRYYIEWFKTRQKPEITRDRVFFFYRVHPKTVPGLVRKRQEEFGFPAGAEKLKDRVFFASFLTEPATLKVMVGNVAEDIDLKAGADIASVPMALGVVSYVLERDGKVLGAGTLSEPIGEDGRRGNFNYTSGELGLTR